MNKNDVLRAALALPEDEREDLAYALLASVNDDAVPGLSYAWREEIERRVREADAGLEASIPWEVLWTRLKDRSRD